MKSSLILGALLLAAAPTAFAQSTAELTIGGEIVPNACTPVLSGNGHIALGTFDMLSLDAVTDTALPAQPVTLRITCSGATSIGYSLKDNRPGTVAGGGTFGLGVDGAANNIGSYNVRITAQTADSAATTLMTSTNQGAAWAVDAATKWDVDTAMWRSVGTGTTPASATTQVLELEVDPIITGTDNLDFASTVVIDGSTTLTIHYL